eukprot:6806322-Ditylum_brightwellii.AAC.1
MIATEPETTIVRNCADGKDMFLVDCQVRSNGHQVADDGCQVRDDAIDSGVNHLIHLFCLNSKCCGAKCDDVKSGDGKDMFLVDCQVGDNNYKTDNTCGMGGYNKAVSL